jgi:hypothetical protein
MSLLPAFLELDGRPSLPVGAGAPGESSSAFHPAAAAAHSGIPGQKIQVQTQPAPPDEDFLP